MYPESGSRNQRAPLPDLRPLVRLDHPGRPDLLVVMPTKSMPFRWDWETKRNATTSVSRFQLAVLPTGGATPFTAQGMNAIWAMVHLVQHSLMNWQALWYGAVTYYEPRGTQTEVFGNPGRGGQTHRLQNVQTKIDMPDNTNILKG